MSSRRLKRKRRKSASFLPNREFVRIKEELARTSILEAAMAEIKLADKIADQRLERKRAKAQKRADAIVDRYIDVKEGKKLRTARLKRGVEQLAKTAFGRQALLKACEKKGIDINTYAEMLKISAKVGRWM